GGIHPYFFFSAAGCVSDVVTVDSWVCDSSTLVVCPPISMDSSPFSSSLVVDFSTRPLVLLNRMVPLGLLLFSFAPLILNGRPPGRAPRAGSFWWGLVPPLLAWSLSFSPSTPP